MPHLPTEYAFASADVLALSRALDDFKRGHPVVIEDDAAALLCAPAEQLTLHQLEALAGIGELSLLAPASLARQLGCLPSDDQAVRLSGSVEKLHALLDISAAPRDISAHPATELENAAIMLARQGSVLPLLAVLPLPKPLDAKVRAAVDRWQAARLSPKQIALHNVPLASDLLTTPVTKLPLQAAPDAQAFAFRLRQQPDWHLAILFGDPAKAAAPLVRVHSACLTGDLLGSLRCDCGSQLQGALEQMAQSEGGVLLYLSQEGRGIGIGNKIRAYHLQDNGMDTREANEALGFDADARDYALAALVLKSLKLPPIRLLTNNPRKVEALTRHRLAVRERLPLKIAPGEHNHRYLEAKAAKLGHLFD